jgi:tight adherence protein B
VKPIISRIGVALAAVLLILCALAGVAWAQDGLRLQDVDTESYPEVTLTLALPAEQFDPQGPIPEFAVEENGRKARVADVEATDRERGPLDALLVIDTSGSMAGAPLKDAKDAARAFIGALAPGDQVALLAFSGKTELLTGFTDDLGIAEQAVGDLTAGGETALYDALTEAAGLVADRGADNRSIIVLADGADDSSGDTLDATIKAIEAVGVPVYAVALESPDFDFAPLRTIAGATGGNTYTVAESSELTGRFESIARELQNLYRVTFTSEEPNTAQIELDVTAQTESGSASLATAIENPGLDFGSGGLEGLVDEYRAGATSDPWMLAATVVLFFLAVVTLVTGLFLLLARGPNALSQLEFYDQLHDRPDASDAAGGRSAAQARMMEAIGWVAGRRGITELLRQKLEQAGLPLRPLEYMYVHIVTVVAVGIVAQLLTGSLLPSVMLVFVASIGPLMALEMAIDRRRNAFEEQLPEILSLIAGSVRSGWGLLQSLDLVVQETAPPASVEFRRVESEARLGLPLAEALEKMAARLDSEDFRWVVIAINIQREVGGNLAEILDILSATMRERAALKRHVRALTAEGRLSAIILYALPFFTVFALSIIRPDYFLPVLSHPFGLAMLAFGIALLVIGGIWLSRVTKVEV